MQFLDAHHDRATALAGTYDIGEISFYGYINAIRQDEPGIPVLGLFEDEWFLKNQYTRPRNIHLLSLSVFMKFLEKAIPGLSFSAGGRKITIRTNVLH